ncbi:uncharacterized protein LOC129889041 [Solanum dulcamara]|uniref:uncharacterized protein LOC129889041 n=1 Tax=Solanum dulcamara TaxID=45834 RepID=UPI0024857B56|nr:uncharacterized protein LOC129889041 [Solanum dulcamara]
MEALKESTANLVVYLHPSKAKKVEAAVYRELSSLLFKFNESLDGVVLTYKPKFSSNLAKILPGIHPYFGVRFEAKLLLFYPKPEMLLGFSAFQKNWCSINNHAEHYFHVPHNYCYFISSHMKETGTRDHQSAHR